MQNVYRWTLELNRKWENLHWIYFMWHSPSIRAGREDTLMRPAGQLPAPRSDPPNEPSSTRPAEPPQTPSGSARLPGHQQLWCKPALAFSVQTQELFLEGTLAVGVIFPLFQPRDNITCCYCIHTHTLIVPKTRVAQSSTSTTDWPTDAHFMTFISIFFRVCSPAVKFLQWYSATEKRVLIRKLYLLFKEIHGVEMAVGLMFTSNINKKGIKYSCG